MRIIQILIAISWFSLIAFTPVRSQDEPIVYTSVIKTLQLDCICKAEWNADGSLLAVSVLPDLQIWDTNTWELLHTIPEAYANSIEWHPTENRVATVRGGREQGVIIWDAETGEIVQHLSRPFLQGGAGAFSHTLAWSPDGSKIATDGAPDAILIWDLAAETVFPSVLVSNNYPEQPYFLAAELKWSTDGRWLLANGTDEIPNSTSTWNDTHLYDATTGELVRTFKVFGYIAWGADDAQFASSYDGGSVIVWDIKTGDFVAASGSPLPYNISVYSLSWNLEQNLIVSAYSNGYVRIWDVDNGTIYWMYNLVISDFLSVTWKPGSLQFAVAGKGGVVIVDFDPKDLH